MTKDNDNDEGGEQENTADFGGAAASSGVWRNARQTLKRAKQEARQTFRSLTWRWPVTRRHRHHPKANAPNAPLEWQQPEGVATNSTSSQPTKGGQTVTHEPVTAPLAKPETADFAPKPASVAYTEFEQAGNVRGYGTSPRLNHRFVYADDEDPGIMSESETSATGTAFGRRNGRNKYSQNGVNNGQTCPTSSTYNVQNGSDKSLGLVFLHYQGETKRALLPDEIRSLNDIRNLFIKAFPTILNADYLQASHVKIYIQDPTRQDVFYELDDLRDVKDRAVLKLHEQLRPISPIPLSTSGTPLGVCSGPVYDTSETLIGLNQQYQTSSPLAPTAPTSIPTMPRSLDGQDMNGFNDQEFERNYRLQKCASSSYAASNGYERRYGTLDSVSRNGGGGDRVRYSSAEPPSKPQRYASPLSHNRNNQNGRRSRSPPSSVVPPPPPIRSSYGTGSESKIEAYAASRGYSNYGDSQIYNNGSSDRSSSVSRCGSVTPVIDEEARVRMINMEKQLASLSSLVHSALMAKGVSETVYKDIEMLRREILGPLRDDISESGSVSRFSDVSSDKGSFSMHDSRDSQLRSTHGKNHNSQSAREYYPSAFIGTDFGDTHLTPEAKSQLKTVKKRVGEMQIEVRQLRRSVQLNAQTTNDILKDVFDRIKLLLNTNKHLHLFAAQAQQQNLVETNPLLSDRSWVNQEQERYRNLMRKVEQELSDFEKHIEELRQRVINGERKLKLSEVEMFTESLTHIGRSAANLKTQFPSFQQRLKQVMGAEMEKVVKEEKFLKDEPNRLDGALQRCKKLTNTMLTMKKLALVQDRSAYHSAERERPTSATPMSLQNVGNAPPPKPSKLLTACADAPPLPPPPKNYQQTDENTVLTNTSSLNKQKKPIQVGATNGKPAGDSSHVLDTLLEELQTVAKSGNGSNGNGHGSNGNGNGVNGNGNGHEKQNGNGEKRVNFVDQVKHFPIDDETNGSDTIKRSPKGSSGNVGGYSNGKSNGPLNGFFDEIVNGSSFERRLDNSPHRNSPNHQDRAHSSTPSSVCSEPASFGRNAAPPPPPRSSSRSMLGAQQPPLPPPPGSRASFTGNDIDELKKQLMSDMNGALSYRSDFNGRSGSHTSGSQTPIAMVQTNAVDVDSSHGVKSASSSDSVNSQDALRPTSPYYNHKVPSIEQQNNNKTLSAREAFFNQLQQNNGNGNVNNNNNETEKKSDGLTNGSQWI